MVHPLGWAEAHTLGAEVRVPEAAVAPPEAARSCRGGSSGQRQPAANTVLLLLMHCCRSCTPAMHHAHGTQCMHCDTQQLTCTQQVPRLQPHHRLLLRLGK